MKKSIRLIVTLLIFVLFSGCTLPWDDSLPGSSALVVSPASSGTLPTGKDACTAVEQRGDYQSLPNSRCRQMYDKLLSCAQQITGKKNENGYLIKTANLLTAKLSDEETKRTVMAFFNDNPQIFWISNQYTYTFTLTGTSVQLYSRVTAQERESLQKKLDSIVNQIMKGVTRQQSELEREATIFNALADRCTYDNAVSADSKQQDWQPYTAYGALVKGKAVCDGYSRAMQLLCGKAGVQCRLVNGSAKGAAHIWNLVRIDGKWYHFDATWMDNNVRIYDYFNVTAAIIQKDHKISPVGGDSSDCNFSLPAADSMEANYYRKLAVQVSALDRANRLRIARALVKAAQQKSTSIALHIDVNLPYNSTLNQLFNGQPYFFQSCVQYANSALPEKERLSYAAMQYSTVAAQGGVSVRLAYVN